MARATAPSLREVLDRWAEQHVMEVNTEMTANAGTIGASVELCTQTGIVDLLVTGVRVENGAPFGALDEVSKAFTQLTTAPADAALLAAEVQRLRAQVKELQAKA